MPAVTMCIPVYNSERSIDACLESVFEQTYQDFECLVVDNSSTDSTVQHVKAFDDPRIRLLENAENIGPIANHNRCIRLARSELIQFVHGDDRLLPNCLAQLVPAFTDRRVGLAFARRRIESSNPKWGVLIGTLHTPLEPLDDVNDGMGIVRRYVDEGSRGNWIGEPTSVMLRRSLLTEVGGFSIEQRSYSDMDLWLRVLARSDAAWVDRELSVRVQHDDTLTAQYDATDEAWLDRLWILSSLATNDDLDRPTRTKARRQWIVAVLKKSVRAQLAPSGCRMAKFRQLARHMRLAPSTTSRCRESLAGPVA